MAEIGEPVFLEALDNLEILEELGCVPKVCTSGANQESYFAPNCAENGAVALSRVGNPLNLCL